MQVSHQRCRQNADSTWPEYWQQFNSGAPALNSLISSDVSAHAARIGFHKRGGKLLGNGFGLPKLDASGGSRPQYQERECLSKKGRSEGHGEYFECPIPSRLELFKPFVGRAMVVLAEN
jgi:hypothetical protein